MSGIKVRMDENFFQLANFIAVNQRRLDGDFCRVRNIHAAGSCQNMSNSDDGGWAADDCMIEVWRRVMQNVDDKIGRKTFVVKFAGNFFDPPAVIIHRMVFERRTIWTID